MDHIWRGFLGMGGWSPVKSLSRARVSISCNRISVWYHTVRLHRTTKTMTMTYIWIIHLYSAVINITRFRDRINISDANSEHWQLVLLWDFKNGKKEKSFHDLKFQGWPCTCIADWSVSCSFVSLLYNKKYLWLTLTQTFSQSCPLVLATLCQLNIKIPLTVSVKYLVRITIVYVKYLILFQGPHLWYFNFNYKKVKGTFTLHKLFKWIQFEHFQWRACIE